MRYHYEPPYISLSMYGEIYICDHPVDNTCTLFKIGDLGLAVIQQRYDPETKMTWWGHIDSRLTDDIYLNLGFKNYFDRTAGLPINDIYPTVTVRQIMWALRMKPLKKERWETVFDHSQI